MRVDLDAKVFTREGAEVGHVHRAIVDPRTNEVTDLVIGTGGFLGRDVRLPIAEIERADLDGDAIRLTLTRADVEKLPEYQPTEYVTPASGWLYPGAYRFTGCGGFVWPTTFAYDAGMAPHAAADIAVAAATGDPSIEKGACVFDRDGADIGVVDDLRFDPTNGALGGFVVRLGGPLRTLLPGGRTVEVAIGQVESVGDGEIVLRVGKAELVGGGVDPTADPSGPVEPRATATNPWGSQGPIELVQVGMTVVDAAGDPIGRVAEVAMGDASSATAQGNEPGEPTLLGRLGMALVGDHREPMVPEPKRSQLRRCGFIKVDGYGPDLLDTDRYVRTDLIAGVAADTVRLTVPKEDLPRAS
jgi:sporulation protein YlmC with PRC-barrel domain